MLVASVIVAKFSIVDFTDSQADIRRLDNVFCQHQVGDTPGPARGLHHELDAVFTGDLGCRRNRKTVSGIKAVVQPFAEISQEAIV